MAESTINEYLPPSGYEEDFVNTVEEDFQCLICHLPLKEPVLTRCGHRFCKECLEEHNRRYEFILHNMHMHSVLTSTCSYSCSLISSYVYETSYVRCPGILLIDQKSCKLFGMRIFDGYSSAALMLSTVSIRLMSRS